MEFQSFHQKTCYESIAGHVFMQETLGLLSCFEEKNGTFNLIWVFIGLLHKSKANEVII